MLTPAEWAALTIQPVIEKPFRAEHVTEGKIAIDEDRSTPVFSPYAGRVTKLLVRPGDSVTKGQPLFTIEAADTVQAQNDYITAMTAMNKARSALGLAEIQDKRARDLFEGKAVPLKDDQQAGQSDAGAKRPALVADGAGGLAQQASGSSVSTRRISRPSARRAASIRKSRSWRRSLAPWFSARWGPANMSAPAPAIPST